VQQSADKVSWLMLEPAIMEVDRYLSVANAPDLEEDVSLCIQSGTRSMILDCSRLTYATISGLRVFLGLARKMNAVGGSLLIKGLKGQPREFFFSCGMDAVVSLVKSERRSPALRVARA